MKIFEPAFVIGIALDVVEEIAIVGFRQETEALAGLVVPQFEAGRATGPTPHLELGLCPQPRLDLGASLRASRGEYAKQR
jgi:hypothetical protein